MSIMKTCETVAGMLRERFSGAPGVTVVPEDSCNPAAEAEKALGSWGVLVLVAASGHRRAEGAGASTAGELTVELTVIENPKRNRKSATPGPTVTGVAEAARDALHWRQAGAHRLGYVEMQRADRGDDDYRMVVLFAAQAATPALAPVAPAGAPEPEEVVERRIMAAVSAALPGWQVVGALAPAADGAARELPATCIAVSADVVSQEMDWTGPGVPRAYSAGVEVRCARADDTTGRTFRDACRAVRSALAPLLGDGCAALDGEGFTCDAFLLEGTETPIETAGADQARKTYRATVKGRYKPLAQADET